MAPKESDPLGYYATLGITPDASAELVRKAYRDQSAVFHPDRAAPDTEPEVRDEMRRRFQRINEAYQVLGDSRTRAAYDAAGEKGLAHLSVVPASDQDPHSIARTIDLLEKKADLERTAETNPYSTEQASESPLLRCRCSMGGGSQQVVCFASNPAMIGASSTTTMSVNGVRAWKLFTADSRKLQRAYSRHQARKAGQPQLPADAAAPPSAQQAHPEAPATPDSSPATSENRDTEQSPAPVQQSADGASPAAEQPEPSTTGTEAPAEQQQAPQEQQQQEPLMLQMAVGNFGGQQKLAIIPNAELLVRLGVPRESAEATMANIEAQANAALAQSGQQTAPATQQGGGGAAERQMPRFLRWRSLLPDGLDATHTFQQIVGEKSVVAFTVGSKRSARESDMHFKMHGEYRHSAITTMFGSLRIATSHVKAVIGFVRELSPLWTLKAKLGLIDKIAFLPSYTIEFVRKMSETWTLTNAVEWGFAQEGGSFSSTLMRGASEDDNTLVRTSITGVGGLSIAAQHARTVALFGATDFELPAAVSGTVSVDPFSLRLSTTADLWITKFDGWAFGAGFVVSMPIWAHGAGIGQIRLLYRRGKHAVHVPITVLAAADASVAYPLGIALFPAVAYRLALVASAPLLRAAAVRRSRSLRAEQLEELRAECQRARNEVEAMRRTVERKAAEEDSVGGLVIRNARLGVGRPLAPEEQQSEVPLSVDVTLALQNCVHNSQLKLAKGTKAGIPGIFDPHPSATVHDRMTLRVEYWFNHRRHEVEVPADAELTLPQEHHLVRLQPSAAAA